MGGVIGKFRSSEESLPPGLADAKGSLSDSISVLSVQSALPKNSSSGDTCESMAVPEKTGRRAWLFSLGVVTTAGGAGAAYKAARTGGKGWIASAGIFLIAGVLMMFSGAKKS